MLILSAFPYKEVPESLVPGNLLDSELCGSVAIKVVLRTTRWNFSIFEELLQQLDTSQQTSNQCVCSKGPCEYAVA
jgi:hypothetical protein